MLDINPIKKEERIVGSQDGVDNSQKIENHQSVTATQDQSQKPLKTLNSDFLSSAKSAPEPEFLESRDTSRSVFYFALVATFLVIGMAGYLYFAKKTKAEELKTKEKIQADIEEKIASPDLADIDILASKYSLGLDEISKLISKPITYSLLFEEMQKIIPTDVVLTSFDVNEKQDYKISAKGPDLASTSKFVKSLENSDYFDTVFLSNDQLSTVKDETNFTVSVQGVLNEKKLIPKIETAATNSQAKEGE